MSRIRKGTADEKRNEQKHLTARSAFSFQRKMLQHGARCGPLSGEAELGWGRLARDKWLRLSYHLSSLRQVLISRGQSLAVITMDRWWEMHLGVHHSSLHRGRWRFSADLMLSCQGISRPMSKSGTGLANWFILSDEIEFTNSGTAKALLRYPTCTGRSDPLLVNSNFCMENLTSFLSLLTCSLALQKHQCSEVINPTSEHGSDAEAH